MSQLVLEAENWSFNILLFSSQLDVHRRVQAYRSSKGTFSVISFCCHDGVIISTHKTAVINAELLQVTLKTATVSLFPLNMIFFFSALWAAFSCDAVFCSTELSTLQGVFFSMFKDTEG